MKATRKDYLLFVGATVVAVVLYLLATHRAHGQPVATVSFTIASTTTNNIK